MAHCHVGSSNLHWDTPQQDRMNLITLLYYSDVVAHKLKGQENILGTVTLPPSAWMVVVLLLGFTVSCCCTKFYSSIYVTENWSIDQMARLSNVFLCELETFPLVNCRQKLCRNRSLASISHTMQCTAKSTFIDHLRGYLITIYSNLMHCCLFDVCCLVPVLPLFVLPEH